MQQHIAHIALLVADYDQAIQFYTQQLHFNLITDTILSPSKRWVLVAPRGSNSCNLLLVKAITNEQKLSIGNQAGGSVCLYLYTDDLERDYKNMVANTIKIIQLPVVEPWGKVLIFADLYGNKFDLIEPAAQHAN